MTISEKKELSRARAFRNMQTHGDNRGGGRIYARMVSALHRAGSSRTQRELEESINSDGTASLFTRHASGALIAVEG